MTPLYKVAVLLGLVVGFVLGCGEFSAVPRHYAEAFVMYLFGAVMALYMGDEIGKMPPILSTRAVWVAAGVLLMGASFAWMFALK